MKLNTKTIIIILVVVVAAYLVWRQYRKQNAYYGTASAADTVPASSAVDSVEGVIAASGMTSTDAAYVRQFQSSVEASNVRREQMEQKAIQRGYTYAQMLVLDAIWTKYYDNATSNFKTNVTSATKNYVWKVQANIKEM